jgi:hypothetical protein
MTVKLHYKNSTHSATYSLVCNLLRDCAKAGNLSKMETLAIAANLVGKLMAMQDSTYDKELLQTLVAENIELGFMQCREQLLTTVEVSGTA